MWDSLIRDIIGWSPVFVMVAVWLFLVWRLGYFKKGALTNRLYLEDLLKETKRQNATLEKLLAQYEERLTRLEDKSDGTA